MRVFQIFVILLSLLSFSAPAWAGGALKTNVNGLPYRWGETITYNLDQGALKSGVLDQAESQQLVSEAFSQWGDVSGVDVEIVQGSFLPDGGDTNSTNFDNFYNTGVSECYDNDPNTPCYNPIIFDEDGEILEELFGECAQFTMIGYAGFLTVSNPNGDPALNEIKKGQAVFSGACIAPAISKPGCPPCKQVLDIEDVRTLVLHELGHFLGMDHSQVNPDSYQACLGGGCSGELSDHIPTMFPLLIQGAKMTTLHQDDKAYFRRLYGQEPNQGTCSVSGNVLSDSDGSPLRGVEVVARNTDDSLSFTDAMSFVSGAESPRITNKGKTQGNCLEDCGKYEIVGLTPGETYQICTQRILDKFTETRSINPVENPFQGVDNSCAEGVTVTCECPGGGTCPSYDGVDILATNNGVDAQITLPGGSGEFSGGCSFAKPMRTKAWRRLSVVGQVLNQARGPKENSSII